MMKIKAMVKNPENRIFILGGQVREGEVSSSGFLAEEMISRFHVDKVFIGIGGLIAALDTFFSKNKDS